MRKAPSRVAGAIITSAAALMALKLLLVWAQPVKAVAAGTFDDALFIALAEQIAWGNWLGDYTNLTLAKGPGAPLFIAAAYALHLPLPIAQHLLYGAACFAVILALLPVVRRPGWLILVFAVMLFNPMTFDAGIMSRVSRSLVYASVILLSVVSVVGMATWRDRSRAARFVWIAAAGFSAGLAWITREETAMIVPSVVLASVAAYFWVRSHDSESARGYATGLVAALGAAIVLVSLVATVNLANYGTFDITEIRGGPYARAYGALMRIPPIDEEEHIAMSDEARVTAYAASPAFRELEPILEGARGDYWVAQSKYFAKLPTHGRGMHRGWFMWALRDAVSEAGHYETAQAAADYYSSVESEINNACADPLMGCGPEQSSPRPVMTLPRFGAVLQSWSASVRFLVTFSQFTTVAGPSTGSALDLARFEEITRWRIEPSERVVSTDRRIRVLDLIGSIYMLAAPFLTIAALALWIVAIVLALKVRRIEPTLVLSTAALVLVLCCTGVVAMVDGLAFPAINILYLAPAYPALTLFWSATSLCYLKKAVNPS